MSQLIQSFRSTGIITFKPGWQKQSRGKSKNLAFYVAGLKYHSAQNLVWDLIPGEPVKLVFEPNNPHDSQAVAIYIRGRKTGYVPAARSRQITALIERNPIMTARIWDVHPKRPAWKQIKVRLEMVC